MSDVSADASRAPEAVRVAVTATVRVTFLALVAVWGACVALVTITSLPYNPLSMALSLEVGIRSLVPEGWGFFTREPRSLDLYPSQRVGDEWQPVAPLPIAHPRNLFGIDRRPRAIPVEIAVLLDQVEKSDWRETTETKMTATEMTEPNGAGDAGREPNALVPVRVTNPMTSPLLCGPIRIVSHEPVPWAWFASGDTVDMPSWIVELDVQCSHRSRAASIF